MYRQDAQSSSADASIFLCERCRFEWMWWTKEKVIIFFNSLVIFRESIFKRFRHRSVWKGVSWVVVWRDPQPFVFVVQWVLYLMTRSYFLKTLKTFLSADCYSQFSSCLNYTPGKASSAIVGGPCHIILKWAIPVAVFEAPPVPVGLRIHDLPFRLPWTY